MAPNTDRAVAMIAADRRRQAGDESAAETLYELIVEVVETPAHDDLYDTICALVELAAVGSTR